MENHKTNIEIEASPSHTEQIDVHTGHSEMITGIPSELLTPTQRQQMGEIATREANALKFGDRVPLENGRSNNGKIPLENGRYNQGIEAIEESDQ